MIPVPVSESQMSPKTSLNLLSGVRFWEGIGSAANLAGLLGQATDADWEEVQRVSMDIELQLRKPSWAPSGSQNSWYCNGCH